MDRKICKSNNNNDKSPSLDNQIPLSEKSNENLQSSKHIQNITDSHNDNKPAKMMVESASVLTIEKEMQKLPIKSGSTLSFKSERIVNRKSNSTTSFPYKLHEILSRPELSHIISWKPHGRAWRVLKQKDFMEIVMPGYFSQTKFSSFIRQVNGWGFHRLTQGIDQGSYYNEYFLKDGRHQIYNMKRLGNGNPTILGGGKSRVDPDDEPDFYDRKKYPSLSSSHLKNKMLPASVYRGLPLSLENEVAKNRALSSMLDSSVDSRHVNPDQIMLNSFLNSSQNLNIPKRDNEASLFQNNPQLSEYLKLLEEKQMDLDKHLRKVGLAPEGGFNKSMYETNAGVGQDATAASKIMSMTHRQLPNYNSPQNIDNHLHNTNLMQYRGLNPASLSGYGDNLVTDGLQKQLSQQNKLMNLQLLQQQQLQHQQLKHQQENEQRQNINKLMRQMRHSQTVNSSRMDADLAEIQQHNYIRNRLMSVDGNHSNQIAKTMVEENNAINVNQEIPAKQSDAGVVHMLEEQRNLINNLLTKIDTMSEVKDNPCSFNTQLVSQKNQTSLMHSARSPAALSPQHLLETPQSLESLSRIPQGQRHASKMNINQGIMNTNSIQNSLNTNRQEGSQLELDRKHVRQNQFKQE